MPYRIRRIIRAPYVYVGAIFDRWYDEMPWRQRVPAGRRGEQVAARHLKRSGYLILARNYRAAGAEIDLVALHHGVLVFVEVKCRQTSRFGTPEESITASRYRRLAAAVHEYLARHELEPESYRIDLVAIEVSRDGRVARHDVLEGIEGPA